MCVFDIRKSVKERGGGGVEGLLRWYANTLRPFVNLQSESRFLAALCDRAHLGKHGDVEP